jgi:hypothetical protein
MLQTKNHIRFFRPQEAGITRMRNLIQYFPRQAHGSNCEEAFLTCLLQAGKPWVQLRAFLFLPFRL